MTESEAIYEVVALAKKEIGYREGDNNYNKYAELPAITQLYGWKPQNQPWCDVFVDWLFCQCFGLNNASKMTYQPIGKGSALCSKSAQYYKDNRAWYTSPQVGDQIFFIVDGGINHTGIVESVTGGLVRTIEGNTSDMVARRAYGIGAPNIAGYGRPKWSVVVDGNTQPDDGDDEKPISPQTLPTLRRGSKGETVRAAQFLLNGRGCSVGYWGADGDFGSGTEGAVLAFQRLINKEAGRQVLDVDGIIGQQTWAALLGVR